MTTVDSLDILTARYHGTNFKNISVDSRKNIIEIQRNQIMKRDLDIKEIIHNFNVSNVLRKLQEEGNG